MEVLKERSGGLLSSHILKFPVVLLETLLKEVDPKLLTFPFHLKTGTDVFTPHHPLSASNPICTALRLTSRNAAGVTIVTACRISRSSKGRSPLEAA